MNGEAPSLFTSYNSIHKSYKDHFRKIKTWIQRIRFSFSSALFLSFAFHVFLIGFFSFLTVSSSVSMEESKAHDYEVFMQALLELEDEIVDSVNKEGLSIFFAGKSQKEILDMFSGSEMFNLELKKEDKIEFYKKLIKSLLQLKDIKTKIDPEGKITLKDILAFLQEQEDMELGSGSKVYPLDPVPGTQGVRFRTLSKEKEKRLKYLKRFEKFEKDRQEIFRDAVKVETDTGIKYIPIEYYYKESPYEEILAQGPAYSILQKASLLSMK